MGSTRNNDFFFLPFDGGINIVGEILGMCLIAGNQHDRRLTQLINIAHKLEVKEAIRGYRIPGQLVGVNCPRMEGTAYIVAKEILNNGISISRQFIREHGIKGFHIALGIYAQFMCTTDGLARSGLFITHLSQMLFHDLPLFRRVVSTIIMVADAFTHIIHS